MAIMAGSLFVAHSDRGKYLMRQSVPTCPLTELLEQFPFEFGMVTSERLKYASVAM